MCERCAIIENIPIIKRPDPEQLKQAESSAGVYARMKRLSGMKDEERQDTFFREDELNSLDDNPELELPQKDQLNLIDYFHWIIMKNRRRKGLSQKQLAEVLGESEAAISMIEKGQVPENAKVLIKKLEQFFQIPLRKIERKEAPIPDQEPILLDSYGNKLESIPEPELPKVRRVIEHVKIEEPEEVEEPKEFSDFGKGMGFYEELEEVGGKKPGKGFFASKMRKIVDALKDKEAEDEFGEEPVSKEKIQESEALEVEGEEVIEQEPEDLDLSEEETADVKDFNVKKVNLREVRISDLKDLHRKKIQATRQEQLEEQRRIEERQKIIEARKEELRLRREKESNELDNFLGGAELIGGSDIKDINDYPEEVEEFDDELT